MDETSHVIQSLREIGPKKTWSLLVTVFGDCDAGPEAPLAGPTLNALFQMIGMKPEAVRVALHRLVKDNWIESRRVGRTSEYFLTPASLAETRAAWERIYAAHPAGMGNWFVHVSEAPMLALSVPHIPLAPTSCITNSAKLPGQESLSVPMIDDLPDWVRAACIPEEARHTMELLTAFCGTVVSDAKGLEAQAIRMLVLHHWRRLALRDGTWVSIALEPDGLARKCQGRVFNLLEKIPNAI
jgi:phenylacetic acid degradation operon negative regulatory protein